MVGGTRSSGWVDRVHPRNVAVNRREIWPEVRPSAVTVGSGRSFQATSSAGPLEPCALFEWNTPQKDRQDYLAIQCKEWSRPLRNTTIVALLRLDAAAGTALV